jgi:hypothetical protein
MFKKTKAVKKQKLIHPTDELLKQIEKGVKDTLNSER